MIMCYILKSVDHLPTVTVAVSLLIHVKTTTFLTYFRFRCFPFPRFSLILYWQSVESTQLCSRSSLVTNNLAVYV